MKKLNVFIIVLLITACCDEVETPKDALYGDVKMYTEYNILIEYDSLNKSISDTISIQKAFFNEKNQIIRSTQELLTGEAKLDIVYEYNRCNQLQKEIVKTSADSIPFEVNYLYKNSLLTRTISESTNDGVLFQQQSSYIYDHNKLLSNRSITQLFIDEKTGDTIKNSVISDSYNSKRFLTKSEYKSPENPTQNDHFEYIYNGGDLIATKKFDYQDSLTSTVKFEYRKDILKNIIELKSFENKKLRSIKARTIIYK